MSGVEIKDKEKLWSPNPGPQTFALQRQEDEILFTGGRGGGKTDAGIVFMIEKKYIENPKYRGLAIRRNAEDLNDWVDRAYNIYGKLGAVAKGNPKNFTFPSGAKIMTGHLNDENAFDKYKGHEYQKIVIEELTQIASESSYVKLLGSNRSTIEGLKPQMFCTSNPDGEGHLWVKKRFIQGREPNKTSYTEDGRTRIYIPALVEDNPYMIKDKAYMNYLESIKETDPDLYEQWRYGSWKSFQLKGSVYGDLIDEAYNQGRVRMFEIDPNIPVSGLWDLGWDDSTAIWLFQRIEGNIYFVGYYENSQQKLSHYYEEINRLAQELGFVIGNQYVPHDARQTELISGISKLNHLKQLFGNNRVHLNFEGNKAPSKHEGIQGVKRILATSVFHKKNCEYGLEQLKMYRRKFNPSLNKYSEDPIHDQFSHCADALRTGASVLYGPQLATLEKTSPRITFFELANYSEMKYYKEHPRELRKIINDLKRDL